jgi:hypothetical protein
MNADDSFYCNFLSNRAFNEGAAAFRSGEPAVVPFAFSLNCGAWLSGWQSAANEEIPFTLEMCTH